MTQPKQNHNDSNKNKHFSNSEQKTIKVIYSLSISSKNQFLLWPIYMSQGMKNCSNQKATKKSRSTTFHPIKYESKPTKVIECLYFIWIMKCAQTKNPTEMIRRQILADLFVSSRRWWRVRWITSHKVLTPTNRRWYYIQPGISLHIQCDCFAMVPIFIAHPNEMLPNTQSMHGVEKQPRFLRIRRGQRKSS